MSNPRTRNPRFVRVIAISLAAALLALPMGCASVVGEGELAAFERVRDPVSMYSQHPVVCVPTSLGNAAGGLIGAPLALLVYPFVWPATWFTDNDDYLHTTYATTFWGPVLLGGGATGSLFLPATMLLDESTCDLGTSAKQGSQVVEDDSGVWGEDEWLEPEESEDEETE